MEPDFRDMLLAFSEEKVEYLLVGAHALAYHGFVRATGDLDLWVNPTHENSERVYRALAKFGAAMHDLAPDTFCRHDVIFQIGVVPIRIDVISSISGVNFEDAWPQRGSFDADGVEVPVLGLNHLMLNKRSTGREKDRHDAERLLNLTGKGRPRS